MGGIATLLPSQEQARAKLQAEAKAAKGSKILVNIMDGYGICVRVCLLFYCIFNFGENLHTM